MRCSPRQTGDLRSCFCIYTRDTLILGTGLCVLLFCAPPGDLPHFVTGERGVESVLEGAQRGFEVGA